MAWGSRSDKGFDGSVGMFYWDTESDPKAARFLYETKSRLYVATEFRGSTICWRRFLKPRGYTGKQVREFAKDKGVGRPLAPRVISAATC